MRPKDKTITYPACPLCSLNVHVRKKGFWDVKDPDKPDIKKSLQRFHCTDCDFHFSEVTIRRYHDTTKTEAH